MFAPFSVAGDAFARASPSSGRRRLLSRDAQLLLRPPSGRQAGGRAPCPDQTTVQDQVVFMSNFFDVPAEIAPVKK